jgi:hypothetical protein
MENLKLTVSQIITQEVKYPSFAYLNVQFFASIVHHQYLVAKEKLLLRSCIQFFIVLNQGFDGLDLNHVYVTSL